MLAEQNIISNDHLVNVCKYRQPGCCRYIFFSLGMGEFCCIKKVDEMRRGIDQNLDEMTAVGDNCEGLPDAAKSET
jgi:hypothetical protein